MSVKRTSSKTYSSALTAKSFISRLRKEPNELRKKMLLLGYVTSRVEKKKESVFLVGGQAVETYTAGQFTSGDIDVATSDSPSTEKVLKSLGFRQIGVIWFNEKLGVAFDIVGDFAPERPRTLKVGPYKTRIVGVEELILDRLSAAKFWNIPADYEKAKVLYDNFEKQLDKDYLREIAKKKKVDDLLLRITETPSPKLGR
ncbi:hypothetical protein E6H11_05810 [Candidatus Bathyarchaeota archaeon]|nr:MAG: hypothetical protein E6H11_05810 [Candidatus Bathyarchaeota archaeon]